MKNKKVLLLIVVGILIGGLGGGIALLSNQGKSDTSPVALSSPTPTEVPVELATWTDPAGFSFQYPKDIDVNPHDEDKENYTHVELTHKTHPGSLIVWMKDLPASDLAGWIKKDTRFSGASVLDTTLGGEPAKKVLVTDPSKMIIVGAIDGDVLVTVEGLLTDDTYWSSVHQNVVDSFVFSSTGSVPAALGNSGGSVDSGDTSVTEEEVLE